MNSNQVDTEPKFIDKKLFITKYGFVCCPDCHEVVYNYTYFKSIEGEPISSLLIPPRESIRVSFCGCGNVFIREFPHKDIW